MRRFAALINAGCIAAAAAATDTSPNDAFKPDWYPDPLIPFQHPLTWQKLEGARFTAVPFDLPTNQTHGFWVDIYVPTNAVPGDYRGVYRVTAGDRSVREIPVSLAVWNFTLPLIISCRRLTCH